MRTACSHADRCPRLGPLSAPASLQTIKKASDDLTGPYDVVANWPQIPRDPRFMQGSQPACFAETPNRIFIVERGELKPPLDKLPGNKLPNNWNGSWGAFNLGPANAEKPGPGPRQRADDRANAQRHRRRRRER